jgi:hypothetical protein
MEVEKTQTALRRSGLGYSKAPGETGGTMGSKYNWPSGLDDGIGSGGVVSTCLMSQAFSATRLIGPEPHL